ncbi:MAG: hypothetical protein M3063_15125 [Actinomycetota bacterium]|nr:hypothetical protein [Actinomycetota bacterium]MDQ6947672.1 hypothetical protein [Actinomycetota bacterium]
MTDSTRSLEEALASLEGEIDAATRSLGAALKQAKRAKSAAATGQIRELHQAMENAERLADQAAGAVAGVRSEWQFDVSEWLSSGEYAKELLATAAEAGVQAFESDERILCYPAIVAISATDASVVVDKKKDRRIRPSVIVRALGALQERPPKFKPEPFIASLAAAYDLVVGAKGGRPGVTVKLIDVHAVLTLLPGAARDYTRQELARDLYLLDQSGLVDTKDGRRMSLPASALTRGTGVLTTATRAGQTKVYAGITFGEGSS